MDISQKAVDEANISLSSKRTYLKYLNKFYTCLDCREVTPENVHNYIDERYRMKNTRRLVTVILNTYVLKPRGLQKLPVPGKEFRGTSTKNHFSEEQLQLLINVAKVEGYTELYHCLSIGMYTGLRISEILNLTCLDIIRGLTNQPLQLEVIRGKGNKSRIVMICASDSKYFLYELLPFALSRSSPTSRIITTQYDNMRQKLKLAMLKAGIYDNKKMGFHATRSFFATQKLGKMIRKNIPYSNNIMRQLLGHSSLKMTRRYIRPDLDAMRVYAAEG